MDARNILQSLEEIRQFKVGERSDLESYSVTLPPVDVKLVRNNLGLSQAKFAQTYGLTVSTVRNWEQGSRSIEGPARTLLALIKDDPKMIATKVAKLRTA